MDSIRATDDAGRPANPKPLHRAESQPSFRRKVGTPFFIGVAGGTASGKTTVCNKIMHRLNDQCVALIHQDSFYRDLTPEEIQNVKYDDVRLARRIQRDVQARGRDVSSVIEQYTKFVKPCFDKFVAPSRRYADVIIPWQRGDNIVAIDLITENIRTKLQQHSLRRIYPHLEVIPSNYQIRGMHTIIRDATTNKNDFVFYADRLNRLVVEAGLGLLPFSEKVVTTPTGHAYVGVDFARKLCGVSIIRSGESMESALRTCCKGIKIGKILVDVIYEKLPADIAERHVLLMDPVLSTGNSACRAIEVLLERGVLEEKIFLLSIIAAPEGISRVCSRFPALRVITSEIDDHIDEHFSVVPGCGEFGDRYFCD
eukprot:gene8007-8205_t